MPIDKPLMDGYVGVKYRSVPLSNRLPAEGVALEDTFRRCGARLAEHGMAPANGGNLSQRLQRGFVITCSGCNLGLIEPGELAWVETCSLDEQWVRYEGPEPPSSEAMLHWLIYRDFSRAGAIVHAHDELATSGPGVGQLRQSAREEPYGTVALARAAAETFDAGDEIIVLRNHGYVAQGTDLEHATSIVVQMHLTLMAMAE